MVHGIARLVLGAALATALAGAPGAGLRADQAPAEGTTPEKLEIIEHAVGQGAEVRVGAFVVAHYDGYVFDPAAPDRKGRRFVSSRERGATLTYVYGYKRAVPGFERGLRGMRVGGMRTIIVPPRLGYDDRKYPRPADVPPRAALVFDVELLEVVPQGAPPD